MFRESEGISKGNFLTPKFLISHTLLPAPRKGREKKKVHEEEVGSSFATSNDALVSPYPKEDGSSGDENST